MSSRFEQGEGSTQQGGYVASADGAPGRADRADRRTRPRRQSPRYPVRRMVELRLPDGSRQSYETRDVSAGGVFLATVAPLPLFAEVQLLLRARDEACLVPARVVHIVSAAKAGVLKIVPGMGLQFDPQDGVHAHGLAIAQLVREAQSQDPRRRIPRLVPGADLGKLADPMLGYVVAEVDGVSAPEAIADALALELEVTETLLRELARAGVVELISPLSASDSRPTSDRAAEEALERGAGKLDPVVRARLDALSGVIADADHYAVLGLAMHASRQEVFAAYVELSRVLHPDSHIGRVSDLELALLERTYARIVEAYGVLSRPAARAEFDEYMDRRRGHPTPVPASEAAAPRTVLERCLAEAERAHREGRPSDAERHVHQLRALVIAPEDRERVERVCALVLGALAADYEKQALYEERHQKWSAAARSWQRVGEGRPEDPQPWRHAALATLAAEGDVRRAIELAKRAVELSPLDAHSRRVLGHAYLAAGMKSSARDELEAAVRLGQRR